MEKVPDVTPEPRLFIGDDGFSLPLTTVTGTTAIIARRRSGKTYTGAVLAEEMIGAGAHCVVIDPLGVWYGLRAGADGEAEGGLPIVIIGGKHADLPLNPTAAGGRAIADLVVDSRLTCVIDVSQLLPTETGVFLAAFLMRLFIVNTAAIHLFVDEADLVAPQVPSKSETAMLDAMDTIVRRGGQKGLGVTMITQRPAVLAKNVFSQIDTLIVLRISAAQDRKAVSDWISGHGTDATRNRILGSLASLDVGDAWVCSGETDEPTRIHVRRRRTFDTSSTPKVGENLSAPVALASLQLDTLREKFAAEIDAAANDDPELLRARIVELERQLATAPARVETIEKEVEKIVEVPVLAPGDLVRAQELADSMIATAKDLFAAGTEILTNLRRIAMPASTPDLADSADGNAVMPTPPATPAEPVVVSKARRTSPPAAKPPTVPADGLSLPQQRILDALAAFAALGIEIPARKNVAVWADASAKSSSFSNNLSTLRTRGLVDYPSGTTVRLTEAGRAVAAQPSGVMSKRDLLDRWKKWLSGPQAAILEYLWERQGTGPFRIDVAAAIGASANSSSFSNNLSALRSLGLIDYPNGQTVTVTKLLFPQGISE